MKRLLPICVTVIALLGLVCPVTAHPTVKIQGGPYQAGSGGEFTVNVLSGDIPGNPVGSQFQSFCIETNEYVSFGQTYYTVLNDKAIKGGSGGPEPDPLDPRTAWLYSEFLNGTLNGYDFDDDDIGRNTSAGALQNAIWYIEQEKSAPTPGSLADDFLQLANASDWYANSSIGNIRVLNLYNDLCLNTCAQDMLVRIPAPSALILTMIGTTFVGWLRKRRTL